MRAEINEDGCLSLEAETPTEAYALKQWWKNFQRGDNMSSLSVNYDLNVSKAPENT